MNPCLNVNINDLIYNSKKINKFLLSNNIKCFPVLKVLSGNEILAKTIIECGFEYLADSRIDNLILYKNIKATKVLIRSSEISRLDDILNYSDISCESELYIIKKLNEKAIELNTTHSIILMFDLGDLREGIMFNSNYLNIVKQIAKLTNIELIGIGANFSCFGGVLPTKTNLLNLVNIKKDIEEKLTIQIPFISGGNSSSLYLINNGIPKEINSLRIGEAIYLGHETAYYKNILDLKENIFTLSGEIIEIKEKVSKPIGKIGYNAFRQKPHIKDEGIMIRAIVNIGKNDVDINNITPIDSNVKLIGQSSDHLIINITNANYILGSTITFNLNYSGLMQVFNSKYINYNYIKSTQK